MSESRTSQKTVKCRAFTLETGKICHSHKYSEEFETICELGEGGFSKVFRAKSRLDQKDYAIKRISIKLSQSSRKAKEDIEAALNEVRLMTKFNDKQIVKISHAWVEVVERKKKEKKLKKFVEESEDLETYLNKETSFYFEMTEDEITRKAEEKKRLDSDEDSSEDECQYKFIKGKFDEDVEIGDKVYKISCLKKMIIYIQMELCEETLTQRIKLRNEKEINKENLFSESEILPSLKLFKNILRAVSLIHSKGLIHRDLKPDNILFTGQDLKIADFGLTTEVFNVKYKKFSVDISETRKTSADSSSEFSSRMSYHTKNVGTLQYAAPEQINNNFYDQKADIFSLGLIFFELLHPMRTGMERFNLMKNLKEKNGLPDNITKSLPLLSDLILRMCHSSPSVRPDTKNLSIIINDYICKIENSKIFKKCLKLSKPPKSYYTNKISLKRSRLNESCSKSNTQVRDNKEYLIILQNNSKKKLKKTNNNREKNKENIGSSKMVLNSRFNPSENSCENSRENLKNLNHNLNHYSKKIIPSKNIINCNSEGNSLYSLATPPMTSTEMNVDRASMKIVNQKLFILPHKSSKSSLIYDLKDCCFNLNESEIVINQHDSKILLRSPAKKLKEIIMN
jgi:serine/threonine protein kinase